MTSLLIVLAMPDQVIAAYKDALMAHFPGLEISAVNHRDKIGPYIGRAEILVTFGAMMADEVYAQAPNLEWVQALGTGVDRITDQPSLGRHVIVTNVAGIHGPPVAEAAIGSMLALARNVPRSVRAQDRGRWDRFPARLIDGKTAVIYGIGVIAEALAPRLKALGMRVVGVSSAPRRLPGFDLMVPREQLVDALREADHFVLLTPHRPGTEASIGDTEFAAMKRGGFFINLGRGETVDDEALVRALGDGRLAGAALDVFSVEPLPEEHPFWSMPNVIVTPHLGGFYDEYPARALPVVEENLRRFLAGDREHMINVVQRGERTL
ncbi:MAG TPA: D-2-hydroxyacid dehydrogenase [Stellaceae bacterium]|nr:D-2-hydroxyacid dehydrogenase [Stellaceae bacterium]